MMRLRIIFLIVLWHFIFQMTIFITEIQGQDKDKSAVIIKSEPPGAMIYFEGENSFVGITPFKVKSNLIGNYKIIAIKPGYEKSKLEYFFKGTEKGTLRLRLASKTRFKAGLRSLVFPGWGQMYSERKKSGLFLSLVQAGAGLFTLISHLDYNKAYKEYQDALDDYKADEKFSDLRVQKWEIVQFQYKKTANAFDKRETWLYISGGLWIYNFLDSIILFPSF
ncbi:MAG: DUF5683 domain-containing protein, partial [Candidatus Hodarchaeota archaeon]